LVEGTIATHTTSAVTETSTVLIRPTEGQHIWCHKTWI